MILSEIKPKIHKDIIKYAKPYFQNEDNFSTGWADDYSISASEVFYDKLRQLGWKKLGSGSFSNIYGNDKKTYVIKVNASPDPGYSSYVKLIHKFPNKHFPKISDRKTFRINYNNYDIYLIEKLYRIPMTEARSLIHIFDHVMDNCAELNLNILFPTVPRILRTQPLLAKALRFIEKHDVNDGLDMGPYNIMRRKDGTIVITDPYVA